VQSGESQATMSDNPGIQNERSSSLPFARDHSDDRPVEGTGTVTTSVARARCRARSAPPARLCALTESLIEVPHAVRFTEVATAEQSLETLAVTLTSNNINGVHLPIMASELPLAQSDQPVTPQGLHLRTKTLKSPRRDRGTGRRKPRKTPSPEELQGALLSAPALSVWVSPQAPVHDLARILEDSMAEQQASSSSEDLAGGLTEDGEHASSGGAEAGEAPGVSRSSSSVSLGQLDRINDDLIDALVTLLRSQAAAVMARVAAAASLKRLAAHSLASSGYLQKIQDSGALEALCEICAMDVHREQVGGRVALVEQAVRAVGNLAVHDGMPAVLERLGCVRWIVRRMDSHDGGILEAVLCTLSNLAELPATRTLIAAEGLDTLLPLCSSETDRIAAQAGWLVCLLASDETAPSLLAHELGLAALFSHARRKQAAAREEATWALATLSANSTHAQELANGEEGLKLLLELLCADCSAISLQASWALANLALQACARTRLVMLDSMTHLLNAVRRTDEPLLARQSLRCVGSLLMESSARAKLLEEGYAVRVLVEIARGKPSDQVDAAVRALAHACQHPTSAAVVLAEHEDALPLLRTLLSSSASSTHCEAASCIANIAFSTSKSPSLLDPSALIPFVNPLVALLESDSKRTQAQAALALCNISTTADCRMHIIQAGALDVLRNVAASGHGDVQEASRRAIDAVTKALTPNSRRVYLQQTPANARGAGKANNRRSPLSADAKYTRRASWSSPLTKGLPSAPSALFGSLSASPPRQTQSGPADGMRDEVSATDLAAPTTENYAQRTS